jgi:nitroreductase
MNSVLEAIHERRSIRSYKPDPVPRELIEKVIQAGNMAPSAGNLQPWRFVVITDQDFREKLVEEVYPKWKRVMDALEESDPERFKLYQKNFGKEDPIYFSAPAIIFVLGSSDVNCALACENMMLAAHSLGLGSCYVGFGSMVYDEPEIVKALELEPGEEVFGPILLGYPQEQPETPDKAEPKVKWI